MNKDMHARATTNQCVAEETRSRAFLFTDNSAAVTTVADKIVF